MKTSKYAGHALIAIAIIHSTLGIALGWPILTAMHHDGWLASTMVNGKLDMSREAITWFLLSGYFWLLLGALMITLVKHGVELPRYLGWNFLGMAAVMIIIMPASGAYFFIVVSLMILYSKNETKKQVLSRT